jgi:hypothetical protein
MRSESWPTSIYTVSGKGCGHTDIIEPDNATSEEQCLYPPSVKKKAIQTLGRRSREPE